MKAVISEAANAKEALSRVMVATWIAIMSRSGKRPKRKCISRIDSAIGAPDFIPEAFHITYMIIGLPNGEGGKDVMWRAGNDVVRDG